MALGSALNMWPFPHDRNLDPNHTTNLFSGHSSFIPTHTMRKMKYIIPALAAIGALLTPSLVSAKKFEGLAKTPPMGWNSWNTFEVNISEELI